MSCNHKFIFLETWQGSKPLKIVDQWIFFCEKCLLIKAVDKEFKYGVKK